MSELIEWGGIAIPSVHIQETSFSQMAPAIRQGPEGERSDLLGLVKAKFSDFTGGLFLRRNASWLRDLNRYTYNEGLQSHIPNQLALPYKLTTQTVVSGDYSGVWQANLRVHHVATDLGSAGGVRNFFAINKKIIRDVSTSNPALEDSGVTFTDPIKSMSQLVFNGTRYLVVSTGDTTDDTKGTVDPTASPPTFSTIFAHADGSDEADSMESIPTLGNGFNVYYGRLGGTNGLFYSKHSDTIPLSSVAPIVHAGSRDVLGSLSTVTMTKSPTVARLVTHATGAVHWTGEGNVFSSDDNYAQVTFTGSSSQQQSHYLTVYGFDFSALPPAATILGIQVSIEAREENGNVDGRLVDVQLQIEAAAVGDDQADSPELATSDTVYTFGGSSDLWQHDWTVNDLRTIGVRVAAVGDDDAGGGDTIFIDHIQVSVTYRLPGAAISLPRGGFSCGMLPSHPHRWPIAAPPTDEPGSVSLHKELWFVDLQYDPARDGLVGTLSRPQTGLIHVEDMCPYAGGLAVMGDNTGNGISKLIKHIDANGVVRDLGFLGDDGYITDVGGVNMFAAGRVLIVEVVNADNSDTQWWYYFDGTWHASTPLQSKSNFLSDNDSSFETSIAGWTEFEIGGVAASLTPSRSTEEAYLGTASMKLVQTASAQDDYMSYQLTVRPGSSYKITAYLYAVGFTAAAFSNRGLYALDMDDAHEASDNITAANGGWEIKELTFTMGALSDDLEVRLYAPQGTVYWDYVTITGPVNARPLPWGRRELLGAGNFTQSYRYRFFPISTTHLAAARMFQPRNIFESAFQDSGIPKQDGPLYLRTPEFDLGPEENNKVLVVQQLLGRQVSPTGPSDIYGTVQIETETGGDPSFSAPAVNTGELSSPFAEYKVPNSGVAYRTAMHKITLNNAAGSIRTPNGVPFLDVMAIDVPHLSEYKVYVDTSELAGRFPGGWTDFIGQLKSKGNTKATQRFRWGTVDVPATFAGYGAELLNPPLGSIPSQFQNTVSPYLLFREKPGTTS